MARSQEEAPAEGSTAAAATSTESAAAPAVEKTPRKKVVLTLDEQGQKDFGGSLGDLVPRQDYITKRYTVDGVDRGPISRELTRLEGRDVAYQIVFQGTKGKVKAVVAAPAEAPKETTTVEG